jgi:hypothetical protein
MKNKIVNLFLAVFILVSVVNSVEAQQTSSLLAGKVLDEKNVPIIGVDIQITYVPWNKTRAATTNKKGYFCVANLPPGGPYTIKFSCHGYEVQTREILSLELGNINDLSLHMRLENLEAKRNEIVASPLVSNEGTAIKSAAL